MNESVRVIAKSAAIPLVLGIVAGGLCVVASGSNPLGAWIGAVAMATLIVPPIAKNEPDRWRALLAAGAAADGVALALLACVFAGHQSFLQWLACYLVFIAFAAALIGLSRVIGMIATILLASAWLTWPIWLTPHINGAIAAWLTPAHPIFAVNHVLREYGEWVQQRLMYQWSRLGQDVPYLPPRSIWPCVILHLLVGGLALVAWGRSKEASPAPPPESKSAAEGSSARPD
jgi:hypothetical protein